MSFIISVIINTITFIIFCVVIYTPYFVLKEIVRSRLLKHYSINWYTNEEIKKRKLDVHPEVVEADYSVVVLSEEDEECVKLDDVINRLESISFAGAPVSGKRRKRKGR